MAANPLFRYAIAGVHGSAISHTDATGRVWTAEGAPTISDAGIFGAAIDTHAGGLASAYSPNFDLGTGPFTLEAQVYPFAAPSGEEFIFMKGSPTYYIDQEMQWSMSSSSALRLYYGIRGASSNSKTFTLRAPVPTGEWSHIACTRDAAGVLRAFGRGLKSDTEYDLHAVALNGELPLYLGSHFGDARFNGLIAEAWIYKGACKWVDDFIPPDSPHDDFGALPVSSPAHQVAIDLEDGGLFRLAGHVAIAATPTNLPVARRVVLIDERSNRIIRQAWSRPADGYYEFRGIRGDRRFSVAAYDYQNSYRTVIANNLVAEAMA